MKILILNPILYTAEKNVIPNVTTIKDCMIYNLAMSFKELGNEVTLFAAREYKPIVEEKYEIEVIFMPSKFKMLFLPSVLPFQPGIIPYLIKNKKSFDLIISSEAFSFSSIFASIITYRNTVVWQELASHNNKFFHIPSVLWYNILVKLFFRKVLIIARSENAKNFIKSYSSLVSNICLDHGIDLNKFNFSDKKKRQFIVVSQLIPRKNIESIILKFSDFVQSDNFSDFKLIIIGRGTLEQELMALVRKEKLENQILFLGFMSQVDLNKHLRESMALLINTRKDLNMVTIPEAIVSGTPIVTNLVPLSALTIKESGFGIANDNWDSKDLKEITNNNNVYVENCYRRRIDFSTSTIAKKFIDIYLEHHGKK